jgi:DNA-binding NtrC family response regulator
MQHASTPRKEQFRFIQTATLPEALDALRKSTFHLVLLNVSLPDTFAAESFTKMSKAAPGLPIIALVDEDDARKATEALSLGAVDYVFKGCRCDGLTKTMRHVLERKQLVAEREEALRRLSMTKTDAQLTAHLSHEFRNALACIHQFGTIMIDGLAGSVSQEQREYLCIMLENATKIRNVLDDALENAAASRRHERD